MVSDRGTQAIRPGQQSSLATPVDDPDAEQAPDDGDPAEDGGQKNTATGGAGGKALSPRPETGPRAPGSGLAPAQAQTPGQGQHVANMAAAARLLDDAAFKAERERREKAEFDRASEQIRAAVRDDPRLAALSRQLSIDLTPQGLRIQLLDEERQPMFATGSAEPNERARLLLQKVAPVLAGLKQDISIAGHTDAAPFRGDGRSNWELSAERANATRRLLIDAGLQENRLRSVTGNADRDPLLPADPLAAANRRIAITVLRTSEPATQP
jgi:chemotaxis protein MotB